MKLREIFRFEFLYQVRRVRTWLYFAILFIAAFQLRGTSGIRAISPFEIAQEFILAAMLWVVMAPAVAGSAAARDAQTRMQPLIYTAPISKTDYLGGRFLAAFLLNTLILLALPLGSLAAVRLSGARITSLAVFLSSYGVLTVPTAFIFTAVQFSVAVLKRRPILSYLATVLFFVTEGACAALLKNVLNMAALGKVLDPTCRLNILVFMADALTPLEKNTVLIALDGSILANRLLWVGITAAILAFTHSRFRFGHRAG